MTPSHSPALEPYVEKEASSVRYRTDRWAIRVLASVPCGPDEKDADQVSTTTKQASRTAVAASGDRELTFEDDQRGGVNKTMAQAARDDDFRLEFVKRMLSDVSEEQATKEAELRRVQAFRDQLIREAAKQHALTWEEIAAATGLSRPRVGQILAKEPTQQADEGIRAV